MFYINSMNHDRFFKLMLMDLSSELLKLEEELENTVNSKLEINEKINTVKKLLNNLSITELSINRFNNMMTKNNEEKN
jgi:hypothetical protein